MADKGAVRNTRRSALEHAGLSIGGVHGGCGLAWRDVSKLAKDRRTLNLSSQLYRAVGSIGANIAEGYSRQSRKDQARFYEYAWGSAREARGWYFQGRQVLSPEVVAHRLHILAEIARLLLSIIPSQRGYKSLKDDPSAYTISLEGHLDDPPMPQ
jgi:four helix bundle protein